MPNFVDYLLQPWRVFDLIGFGLGLFGAPGGQVVFGANQELSIAKPICYLKAIDNQTLNICSVAGYEMPSFVFFACLCILLLFACSAARLIQQCLQIFQTLARLNNELRRIKAERALERDGLAKLDAQELSRITSTMSSEKLVSQSWNEFQHTLLVEREGRESRIFATFPIESFLTRSSLIEQNVHMAYFNALPGILTGLGLLMTFVAILDGLSHVSVTTTMEVTGIGGLINGLSGKFASSIVAVSCAVSFVVVEHAALFIPMHAYKQLIALLSSRLKIRTIQHLLHDIYTDLHIQSIMQAGFATALNRLNETSTPDE